MNIVESIQKNPTDWETNGYVLSHKPSGLALWVANGWLFCKVRSESKIHVYISCIEAWKIMRAYHKWNKNRLRLALTKEVNCNE